MEDAPRLRVMSYNIKSLRGDPAALTAVVRAISPDVLVLQEAFRWANPLTWFADLGRRFGMVQIVGGLYALGNAVLTGSPVTVHEHWVVRYPLAFGHSPRGATFVRCSIAGAGFVVVGSHLSTAAATRLRQAGVLKEALGKARDRETSPALVGMDVNETAAGSAWQLVAAGLVDPAEKTGQADVPTYPTFGASERIDAIFVDPRCSVLGYRVVDTPQSRVGSDHFPVLTELALPQA
jgi:endonuclease/exonuclease/phosphatase family metal-dependent hydrolase